MLHKLAVNVAHFFVRFEIIAADEESIYVYGMELLLSDILNGVIALSIAIMTHTVVFSIFFLSTFLCIRRFSGGFHAKTHFLCMLTLVAIMMIFSFGIYNISEDYILVIDVVFALLSGVLIFRFAPVSHSNKPISEDRLAKLKTRSRIAYVSFSLFAFTLFLLKFTKVSVCILSGVFLSAVVVLLGYVSNRINSNSAAFKVGKN